MLSHRILVLLACTVVAAVAAPKNEGITVTVYDNGGRGEGVEVYLPAKTFDPETLAAKLSKTVPVHKAFTEKRFMADRVYNARGKIVKEFTDMIPNDRLYLVPPFLEFVWPFVEEGHQVELENGITLESVSDSPRVFRVHNFLSMQETTNVVEAVQALDGDKERQLQRSAVGHNTDRSNNKITNVRTSKNAFLQTTPLAMELKQRAFDTLRVPFDDRQADGLQVLKYEPGEAYIAHTDWFASDSDGSWNWEPALNGSNRFATLFLYLNDVEEGGQTVFPEARDADQPEPVPGELHTMFNPGRWELELAETCYSKLAMKPRRGEAVLFYNQNADGSMDPKSLHGACPVVKGTKWGANLWVWNDVRFGLVNRRQLQFQKDNYDEEGKIRVTFHNSEAEAVSLCYDGEELEIIQPNERKAYNTYPGHNWSAKTLSGREIWSRTVDITDDIDEVWEIKELFRLYVPGEDGQYHHEEL